MASIKKINSRKYKITVSNGYRFDGRKISRAKTIRVPDTVHPRSIAQYVAHEAEEFERLVKNGEDADTTFEDYARSWLKRQTRYAPGTLAMYTRMLEVTFQYIGAIPLSKLRPIALEKMLIEPWHYRLFYILAIYTGCRRGELCALKWSDFIVDGYESTLTVSRSRTSVAGVGVVEGSTKNGRSRTIAIDEDITSVLMFYCCKKKEEAEAGGFEMSDYLFTNGQGELIHPDTFTKRLRRFLDENGFPKDYHLHTMRHFFVSTLLHHGVDKQTVADLAGHGDTSFLERTYCHPQMALKKEAAKVVTKQLLVS